MRLKTYNFFWISLIISKFFMQIESYNLSKFFMQIESYNLSKFSMQIERSN